MNAAAACGGGAPELAVELELCADELRIGPSDAATARDLARIVADPRVGEPYRAARPGLRADPADAQPWEHQASDWALAGRLTLAVRDAGGSTLGCIRFHGVHLSYFLAPEAWRRGHGAAMIAAACRHYPARLGLQRLQARVLRDNVASRRILEGTGFAFKGLEQRAPAGGAGRLTVLRYEFSCR
ncbi:MAG: GNAT family N-acetyltransferase [Burkholderiaceae bacterium]